MLEKIRTAWLSLNKSVTVGRRELILGAAACTMTGMVIGMLISPRKTVTLFSHNGNQNQSHPTEAGEGSAESV